MFRARIGTVSLLGMIVASGSGCAAAEGKMPGWFLVVGALLIALWVLFLRRNGGG